MSLLETIPLEHVPSTHSVHVAFFKDVTNAEFLQSQLLARNPDFEYAFIDASTIVSRVHLLAAVYKALSVLVDGKLKAPNVHAEMVIALSVSNNVRLIPSPTPPLPLPRAALDLCLANRTMAPLRRSRKPIDATASLQM